MDAIMKRYKVIGYVSTSNMNLLQEDDMKALDIINLAFGHVTNGEITWDPKESLPVMAKAREVNPCIKFILSVGGWGSGGFSDATMNEMSREKLVNSAINIVKNYGLDGIDIDWEYPCIGIAGIDASENDKENFTLFLKLLREKADQVIDDFYLSIAAGGDDYFIRCTQMDKVEQYLNYVQIMTYDLRGGFSIVTGHHTNLYAPMADLSSASVDKAVNDYMKAGVPKEKIIIGAAFYSRKWTGVTNRNQGFLQTAGSVGVGSYSYHELVDQYINKNGYIRYWDDEAKAPYLFNGETFLSYDDPESITWKAEYIKNKGLLGMMYWEYSCDQTYTLTKCIRENLK